jgi:hypothetical protein
MYYDQFAPLLERLHDDGCARDRAGNRTLLYDQNCMLILMFLFNPIVTSRCGLQQASELAMVQKKLGCSRAALGSRDCLRPPVARKDHCRNWASNCRPWRAIHAS